MAHWTSVLSGFEMDTGALRVAVTDQRDRQCGWCWHVIAKEEIARGGGELTAEDAKRAAESWARAYCMRTLAALDDKEK